ncbi:hypothetical protein SELSPUOL_00120 [Selenomonas sputigena ATCC 35185]|uniref:Uncharacterized protein n=1 Tax=Selenomonas sputigena (strain ATCC 35185 / DSM 20758 / CCUG 44933 / VPI D19B-28) TaxID=546271 RepID=C9LRQ3_SELS3|nr:hypothetical protein SELSPUOL_00120 [Selenomonas sputigena ATCC 35185]
MLCRQGSIASPTEEIPLGNADKMKSPRFAQMHCIYRGDKPQA